MNDKNANFLTSNLDFSVEELQQKLWTEVGYSIKASKSHRPLLELLPARIEHTLLKTDATSDQIAGICAEAKKYGFRSVCCLPRDVRTAVSHLQETPALVVSVANFPLAGGNPDTTTCECRCAREDGADEIDIVVDVQALIEGDYIRVYEHLSLSIQAANPCPVKIILETSALSPKAIVSGAALAEAAGAHYLKTSTGFGSEGATVESVRLLRRCAADRLGVKASGGIRTKDWAFALIDAGADLLGTSSGISLVKSS